jgi:hypothetical protein
VDFLFFSRSKDWIQDLRQARSTKVALNWKGQGFIDSGRHRACWYVVVWMTFFLVAYLPMYIHTVVGEKSSEAFISRDHIFFKFYLIAKTIFVCVELWTLERVTQEPRVALCVLQTKIFSPTLKKCSSLLQRWRCGCKFKRRRIVCRSLNWHTCALHIHYSKISLSIMNDIGIYPLNSCFTRYFQLLLFVYLLCTYYLNSCW